MYIFARDKKLDFLRHGQESRDQQTWLDLFFLSTLEYNVFFLEHARNNVKSCLIVVMTTNDDYPVFAAVSAGLLHEKLDPEKTQ